jgi:lipopolysaccharide export system permease protein
LVDVIENAPGEPMQKLEAISLPTSIDKDELAEQADGNSSAGFWSMPKTIRDNEAAGFSARELRLRFNRLLSLPIMLIAMTFIAGGVSMSLTREGGTLLLMIIGAGLGFTVFFADSMVGAFGEVAIVPVIAAAWSVPLIVLMLGISHLARIEDG